jgi:uncharacterized protein (TIGR02145 family)
MKKRNAFKPYLLLILGLIILLFNSCKKDFSILKEKISGYVQKGPFVNGTSISIYELDENLGQTGKNFSTLINNNSGNFEISNISLSDRYVEFYATGYYFDEVRGEISAAPLNLDAISDVTDITAININVLTHLERSRVKYLVKQGQSFSNAKAMAQSEILSLFGINNADLHNSEMLNISEGSDENAILLAISIILQGNRSSGELTELLANFSKILEDGISGDNGFIYELRKPFKDLNLSEIRKNLEARYRQLGITATIPDFEKYINIFLVSIGEKPEVRYMPVTNLEETSIILNAKVNPFSLVTNVVFEYGLTNNYDKSVATRPNPVNGFNLVDVSASIEGLMAGTLYHYRVRAENVKGTTYGNDTTFVSWNGKVSDMDGNVYNTIKIGTQTWMLENLKTTKYKDGTSIPYVTSSTGWLNLETPAYCYYNNNGANKVLYGALYNWYTAATDKLCPEGWHVPSKADWTVLTYFLGGPSFAGGKLKEAGTVHWDSPNLADNSSGFTALPGGSRWSNVNSVNFQSLGGQASFWSSTEEEDYETIAYVMWLTHPNLRVDSLGVSFPKKCGLSVRCLRDY